MGIGLESGHPFLIFNIFSEVLNLFYFMLSWLFFLGSNPSIEYPMFGKEDKKMNRNMIGNIDAEDELAQFIDSNFSNIAGSAVATYVNKKFGGSVENALEFLASKGQAKEVTNALVAYSTRTVVQPRTVMRSVSVEKVSVVRPSKLEGYAKFEHMCQMAHLSLKDTRCSSNDQPMFDVEVVRGMPRHPEKDIRLVIPKKFLTDEVKNKLANAVKAQVEVVSTFKNMVFVILIKAYKKAEKPVKARPVFYASVSFDGKGIRIRAPGKDKRITVPKEYLHDVATKRGGWKMEFLYEGDDFIFALPIEKVDAQNQDMKLMNDLNDGQKVRL